MKIAIVTQYPMNTSTPEGGVEAVSVNLVESLSKIDGNEIHVVTLNNEVKNKKIVEKNGYCIHRLPRQNNSELANALVTGRKEIEGCIRGIKPDLIHAHDTYGLMVKEIKLPRVFTIHGFIYGDTMVSGKKFPYLRSEIWKYFEIQGWRKQPYIISISPYVRERVSRFVKETTIHDIDNPISDIYFRTRSNLANDIIFSAAAICPRKNTLALIKAVKEVNSKNIPVQLRLAGTITDKAYGEDVRKYIKKHKLEKKVKLLGNIDKHQVIKELESASIFALLSLEENSPMGIEEAMAVGVPVVTSNLCGMPYMVKHNESGYLVNPNDSLQVAERIEQILTESDLRNQMAEKSREIAKERFHPDKIAHRTMAVYKECIAAFNQ
ncbi:MAG: glycosyltransferase family 4 protein [Candidatus Thiodiazotropha sp. (ex Monitilora ramsayi)]|nr:glycosyltransferase family 4 protein [Candidatus Thiodiazotropha sp. (ex Monitilora ramsayi)]